MIYTPCYHLVFLTFCPQKTIEILKPCDIITFLYSNYCQYVWFEYYFLISVNLLNNSQNMQGLCNLFDKAYEIALACAALAMCLQNE